MKEKRKGIRLKGEKTYVSDYGMWRRLEPSEIIAATNSTYPRCHDTTRFKPKRVRFSNLELGALDLKAESSAALNRRWISSSTRTSSLPISVAVTATVTIPNRLLRLEDSRSTF